MSRVLRQVEEPRAGMERREKRAALEQGRKKKKEGRLVRKGTGDCKRGPLGSLNCCR